MTKDEYCKGMADNLEEYGWNVPWVTIFDTVIQWIRDCLNKPDAFAEAAQEPTPFMERRIERRFRRELRRKGLRGSELRSAAFAATNQLLTQAGDLSEDALRKVHGEIGG